MKKIEEEMKIFKEEEEGELLQGDEESEILLTVKKEEGRAQIMKAMREITMRRSFMKLSKDELVQYIGYCHLILSEVYPEFRERQRSRNNGTESNKKKAISKRDKTIQIFSIMKKSGEPLPIKRKAIYSTFLKYWRKELLNDNPGIDKNDKDRIFDLEKSNTCYKEDRLFDIQREYLANKKRKA
jgi:hypothetical protein